ncbi:MAG: hypothetical protein LVS60_05560 [Nodosilinea sp. LVE1205-7]
MDLTATQQQAAISLAQGKKVAAIAKVAKVSRDTIYDWKQLPSFAALVASTRRDLWQAAISRAIAMVDEAMEVTRSIAIGEVTEARVSDRLAACKIILDVASKLDAVELESRIAALEAREAG